MISNHDFTETYTGCHFYYKDAERSHISVIDIAHTLSRMPRWNCHTETIITVAQHSLAVANACQMSFKLFGLLHDVVETYTGDYPAPFKRVLKHYKDIESSYTRVILRKLGILEKDLSLVDSENVMFCDEMVGIVEAERYFKHYPKWLADRSTFRRNNPILEDRAHISLDLFIDKTEEETEKLFLAEYKYLLWKYNNANS